MPPRKHATNSLRTSNPEQKRAPAPAHQVVDLTALFKMSQIQSTFNDFEAVFQEYHQLTLKPTATANEQEAAFTRLKSHIQKLTPCLKQLKDPDLKKQSGDEVDVMHSLILLRIGTSYLLHKEFALARAYLEKARDAGGYFTTYINLVQLERYAGSNESLIIKAQEQLLDAAIRPEYLREVQPYKKQVNQELSLLLAKYLSNFEANIDFKAFFRTYSDYLSLLNFQQMFDFYKNSPQDLAYWRSALFKTTLSIPNDYYYEHADYLLQTNPQECFKYTNQHVEKFSTDQLACLAKRLLKKRTSLDPQQLHTTARWLTEAAITDSIYAQKCFVDICSASRQPFKSELIESILTKACLSEDNLLKGNAYFALGLCIEEGYGHFNQSIDVALSKFLLASEHGSINANMWLANEFALGQKISRDLPRALTLYEETHLLGSPEAGLLWAQLVVNTITAQPVASRMAMLEKAKYYTEEAEKQAGLSKDIQTKIAFAKARCLMLLESLGSRIAEILPLQQDGSFFYSLKITPNQKNPVILELLQFAALQGEGEDQCSAMMQLAQFHFIGMYVEKDLKEALADYQKALPLALEYELGSFFEFYILIMCSLILQQLSEQASSDYEKKRLQYQALAYSQAAVAIDAESIPEEIKTFVNSLYKKDKTITVTPEASQAIFQALSARLQAPKPDWKIPAAALQALLSSPTLAPTPATILTVTQYISDLGENFLEIRHLFPKLEELVANAVTNAKTWPEHELRAVFAAVGKWHLAGASIALERLFLHLPSHLPDLSFSDWCEYLTYFAKCNFTKDFQTANVLPLVKRFATGCFADTLKTGTFSLPDAARLFHTLALFDCNDPNDTFLQLATSLFTAVKPKLAEALPSDVSQLYHAFHYFRLNYPDLPAAPNKHWRLGANLRHLFQIYKLSLVMPEQLRISRAQSTMHGLLLQIHPKILHEQFIEAAGRRVDFLVLEEDFIIQYNGALHHYVWQNDGSAYPSLKEQLCYLTLVAAGFKVARIDRLEWGRVANNDLAKLDFLCKRLPKLSLEFKRQENSPGDERKFPFHARQKPASVPRASASGNFITQPAPNCSTP